MSTLNSQPLAAVETAAVDSAKTGVTAAPSVAFPPLGAGQFDPWYDRDRYREEDADERRAERAEERRAERDRP